MTRLHSAQKGERRAIPDTRPTVESYILTWGEVEAIRRNTNDATAAPHCPEYREGITARIGRPDQHAHLVHHSVDLYLRIQEGPFVYGLAERQWLCAWPTEFDKNEPTRLTGGWVWEEVEEVDEKRGGVLLHYWQPRWLDVGLRQWELKALGSVRRRLAARLNLRNYGN